MFFVTINHKSTERQTIHDGAQHDGKKKRSACRVSNLRPAFEGGMCFYKPRGRMYRYNI